MNGLLVNSYGCSYDYNLKSEFEEPEPCLKRIKKSHYYTWPRRQKFSKKRKVSQIIHQIKLERAISEIDLKFENSKNICNYLNHECFNRNVSKTEKKNYCFRKYHIKLTPTNLEKTTEKVSLTENNIERKISATNNENRNNAKNIPSDEIFFNENKLGIIRILKNWKLGSDNNSKNYQGNSYAYSDSRSSVSSINTVNENDNSSSCSDVSFSTSKMLKNYEHQNKIISSSHLIHLQRPESLPPKPIVEQIKHQKEYEKMVNDLKKKEREGDIRQKKKNDDRLKEEERLTQATRMWLSEILPNWCQMKNNKKTQNLWWNGLPPRVRGKVWSLSIGNTLNITKEKYLTCVKKSKDILKTGSKDSLQMNENYEHSVELIRLDISRTFPHLCIFQQGGPYYEVLHSLLGAYVCYQPEIGYVQGMSFIAAVLLLNMEELDAFICFANMLNKPCHKAFYSLDVQKMRHYYLAYSDLLRVNIYDLYKHVNETCLSPDLYLVDWVYTLFSKSMNLDLACRIWDLIVRDGENFIFRAALGIMHLSKNELLKMDFLRAAQYLTKLPDDICPNRLFKSISCIRMNNGLFTFEDLLNNYAELIN